MNKNLKQMFKKNGSDLEIAPSSEHGFKLLTSLLGSQDPEVSGIYMEHH